MRKESERCLTCQPAPDALILDMDGLLLDTESLDRSAFQAACDEAGWPNPDMKVYAETIGMAGRDVQAVLQKGYGPDFPLEAVLDIWPRRRLDSTKNRPADLKLGAVEILAYAHEKKIPCGLATSARLARTTVALSKSGLDRYFSVIVTGDDVRMGKPAPEPYVTAARGLGFPPERCWAVEDSANGVRSALAAGCRVFQVPDLVAPMVDRPWGAHEVVETLHDVLEALRAATEGG